MKLRRGIVFGLTAAMALSLTACGGAKTESTKGESAKAESANTEGGTSEGKSSFSIAMITDTGGINDQSFNQSAWEGLTELKNEKGVEVNYIESKQAGRQRRQSLMGRRLCLCGRGFRGRGQQPGYPVCNHRQCLRRYAGQCDGRDVPGAGAVLHGWICGRTYDRD